MAVRLASWYSFFRLLNSSSACRASSSAVARSRSLQRPALLGDRRLSTEKSGHGALLGGTENETVAMLASVVLSRMRDAWKYFRSIAVRAAPPQPSPHDGPRMRERRTSNADVLAEP